MSLDDSTAILILVTRDAALGQVRRPIKVVHLVTVKRRSMTWSDLGSVDVEVDESEEK